MFFAHVHVAINHMPLDAIIIGLVTVAISLFRKNANLCTAGWVIVMVGGLSAVGVAASGLLSEDAVEKLPGVAESIIEEHEEKGFYALFAANLLALCVAWALYKFRPLLDAPSWITGGLAALAGIAFLLLAEAAFHGGHIRHPEFRGSHHHDDVTPAGDGDSHEHSHDHSDEDPVPEPSAQ